MQVYRQKLDLSPSFNCSLKRLVFFPLTDHPNLKLFITHGGLLSTTESIHFGVPLVGIPVLADQHLNMKSVDSKGFGIAVTLSEDMIPELEEAINKVLLDPA